jgi:hypothetical protein
MSIYGHGVGFEVNMAVITIKEVEEVQTYPTGSNILKEHMVTNAKFMNIKVVELINLYNFCFGHIFI